MLTMLQYWLVLCIYIRHCTQCHISHGNEVLNQICMLVVIIVVIVSIKISMIGTLISRLISTAYYYWRKLATVHTNPNDIYTLLVDKYYTVDLEILCKETSYDKFSCKNFFSYVRPH